MARLALSGVLVAGILLIVSAPAGAQGLPAPELAQEWAPADLAAFKEAFTQASIAEGQRRAELPDRDLDETADVSCATPCRTGVQQATHPYYDVFLDCNNGAFTARTGASHSVTALAGSPQNVIFGGAGGGPGTSDISFRVHDNGTTYLDPPGGATCPFDPPDTAMEPASTGIESEWRVSPMPGVELVLREEIVAFGTNESDSGVRLTLGVTNSATSTGSANVGMRWQIDYQNASDDGPLFAPVTCDPPSVGREISLEHEFMPGEIQDFYRIQNNTGFPIFSNVTSTTAILGIPNTALPDRLVYGRWSPMSGSAWNYATVEGAAGPDSDSAVLYYHGYLPADGFVLAPGQSVTRSAVIFTSADLIDCGTFTPGCAPSVSAVPPDRTLCVGDTTTLDASGITLSDCTGTVDYTWRDPGGVIGAGPTVDVSPTTTTTYEVDVTCSDDAGCFYEDTILVEVEQPPRLPGITTDDPSECNRGIKVGWDAAEFFDPSASGVYAVYRSDVSCADALLQPPLVMGVLGTDWFDPTIDPGVDYYYVVLAEDNRMPTVCAPQGPHHGGAMVTRCIGPIADSVSPGTPEGVGAVLRLTHSGHDVTVTWPGARALLPGEHFHLLKAWRSPLSSFSLVNGEGDTSGSFAERDQSVRRQYFDLRVASPCEELSLDEFPPGWDN